MELRARSPSVEGRRQRRGREAEQDAVLVEDQDVRALGARLERTKGYAKPTTIERVARLLNSDLLRDVG
jgi:ribosomal protein L15E